MNKAKPDLTKFGETVWASIKSDPLGSRTKRDMELSMLGAAIDSGLVAAEPAAVAAAFRITLSRAHGYLTDLALRKGELSDTEAVEMLRDELKGEVTIENNHLCIPIRDAALRLWIERKASAARLNSGESIRRDLVKLTPRGLGSLLDQADGLRPVKVAVKDAVERIKQATDDEVLQSRAGQEIRRQEILARGAGRCRQAVLSGRQRHLSGKDLWAVPDCGTRRVIITKFVTGDASLAQPVRRAR